MKLGPFELNCISFLNPEEGSNAEKLSFHLTF